MSQRLRGIDRIRYTTSHPVEFSESLIQAYETLPKLVSHLRFARPEWL